MYHRNFACVSVFYRMDSESGHRTFIISFHPHRSFSSPVSPEHTILAFIYHPFGRSALFHPSWCVWQMKGINTLPYRNLCFRKTILLGYSRLENCHLYTKHCRFFLNRSDCNQACLFKTKHDFQLCFQTIKWA